MRVENPLRGMPGEPDELPGLPHLCSIESIDSSDQLVGRIIAYGWRESGRPLTFITNEFQDSQIAKIVDWFQKETGWTVSKWCVPQLLNQPKPVPEEQTALDYTTADTANDDAEESGVIE